VILLMIMTALLAGVLAPHDPYETSFLDQLKPPSATNYSAPTHSGETCSRA
jgi:hypothetical protein